jgi:lysophospholipase L1-like esterase
MNNELNEINKKEYKTLTPFKGWVIENFPFIEADFDAITNYQLICKVTEYLNTVIYNQNQVQNLSNELVEGYNNLLNYVNNYFENLDVQEEINNKLDEMAQSGTLTNLIANYINPLINEQNVRINQIDNKVDILASGSPLVASSTSEMTDTTRVYVNTTDGKWYYYDGNSWEIGGTYQSSGISNNSIDLLMLDDELQKNLFANYSQPLDLGNAYVGYYKTNGTLQEDSSYKNYHYALENGKYYLFTGTNPSSNFASLLIKDSSNNIIYSNGGTSGNKIHYFKCTQNNLTAYISLSASISQTRTYQFVIGYLRELTGIYNQLRYTTSIPLYLSQNGFIKGTSIGSNVPAIDTNQDYTLNIYQATKGRRYKIKGYNYSNVCGLFISGLDDSIIYASSNSNVGTPAESFTYTYNCEVDSLIYLSGNENIPATIEVINDGVTISNLENKLLGKKLGCDGDSIMYGAENTTSYANLIVANNNMTLNKVARSGATIATGTTGSSGNRHWICEGVLTIDTDCDYVIINGGINDYWNDVPMGTFIESYTDAVDSTTFYGALETLCRNLLSRFPTKKIAFITNHHIKNTYYTVRSSSHLAFKDYLDAIYKVMNKYGIKIIDVGNNTHMNTALSQYLPYTIEDGGQYDGTHPTIQGYNLFYVDYITSELNNL